MALSGVDIRVITQEIKPQVDKSWIVNIYEIPGKIFIFKLRQPGEGLKFLLIEPGKRYHLTNFNREMPKQPTNFATTLRSHLRNTMINWVEQKDMDRIVKLSIGPEPSYTLIIELFGEGNLILVNPKGKITTAMRYRKMKDRDIHPGKVFREMPPQERDILRHGTSDLRDILRDNPRLIPALNNWLGLGPYYSRYILKELGIQKKDSEELEDDEIEEIIQFAQRLEEILKGNKYDPTVYLDPDEDPVTEDTENDELDYDEQWGDEALPFKPENVIKIYPWPQPVPDEEELKIYKPDKFYEAIDVFYSSQETQEIVEGESEQLNTHMDKLETQLEEQQKHMKRMRKMADIYRNYADALYANFQAADELISTIYNAKKNNMPWETIIEKLEQGKKQGMAAAQIFEKIQPEKAKMHLKLPYLEDTFDVAVDFRQSLTDNANDYYQQAKKAERKAEGAAKAIEITKDKIERAEEDVEEMLEKQREKVVILKRRKSWYEKFHWARAPNGTLIIGGYDASSNEKLVKRYLESDDVFAHANLQGASAVIIKSGGDSISETTERVAAQLAVSYSSGWKAKLPVADAFLVESDQVSLTPPSGEYLPKGSFMIYGEKNFVNSVPLEICIGVVLERHWSRVIAGPENCMEEADYYAKLVPGPESRGTVAKDLQYKFKKMADDISAQKIDALDQGELAWYIPGDSKVLDIVDNTS